MAPTFFYIFLLGFTGCSAMSNKAIELKWEWPAGRKTESKALVKVVAIKKASTGFMGIGASPSMADALPDATDVSAEVVQGPDTLKAKQVHLRLPGMEAKKLKVGQLAALGLTGENAVCICVGLAPPGAGGNGSQWFDTWACE